MMVTVIAAGALESEVYTSNRTLREEIDTVGQFVQDLTNPEERSDMLLVLPEASENDRWQLCFSGTTLSLDFYPESIEVTDFNDGDEQVLETFPRDAVKQATQWLVNHARG